MRLQFLPLALCLLLAFYGKNSMAFSEKVASTESAKSIDFKAVSKKAKDKNNLTKIMEATKEDTPDKSPKSNMANYNIASAANFQFSVFEENSYKNITPNPVGTTKNLKGGITAINSASQDADLAASFKNGMFYGFAIMVVLLNLICYFLFDEKIFMTYSLALAGITSTLFFSDGLYMFLGIEGMQNIEAMQSTLLLIAVGFSAWFASRYLTLNEFFPKLRWVTMTLLGISMVIVAMAWASEDVLFATIANTILLSIMASYFLAGILLFSSKNYPKFYVIACSIPLLFAIDFFVLKNFGIDFLGVQTVHLKAAILVEMLLITYAIVYRMRAIKEENLLRQTELRIFLKRQEVMNRRNAAKLMEDVYLENLIMHYDLDGLEIKLLQYISEGKDNSKIARKLKTTELEVESLTKELYHKLEISEHIQEDYRMVDTQPDYIYN